MNSKFTVDFTSPPKPLAEVAVVPKAVPAAELAAEPPKPPKLPSPVIGGAKC